jgi:hypothetical protein
VVVSFNWESLCSRPAIFCSLAARDTSVTAAAVSNEDKRFQIELTYMLTALPLQACCRAISMKMSRSDLLDLGLDSFNLGCVDLVAFLRLSELKLTFFDSFHYFSEAGFDRLNGFFYRLVAP